MPPCVYGQRWASDSARYLHQRNQRRWLAQQQKQRFMNFTLKERRDFRHYFDHLKGKGFNGGVEKVLNRQLAQVRTACHLA